MNLQHKERILSLDVFRGFTMTAMVLVNSQGTWDFVYPQLEHAEWNGWTFTDLIFPFFLFIVGISTAFSLHHREQQGDSHRTLMRKIFFRTFLLLLVGILKENYPFYSLHNLQVTGVLQRIAVVYFFSSLSYLKSSVKTELLVGGIILLIYWALLMLVPIPGGVPANLGPATNLGAYLDRFLLSGHLYAKTAVWDPQGILSTLPAIVSGLTGVACGRWMQTDRNMTEKTVWMFVAGNIGLTIGIFWDFLFPINKNLWTSSYVVFTSGMSLIFFAMIYWIVDVKKIQWWTKPFVVYGMNALTAYVFTSVQGRTMKYLIFVTGEGGEKINLRKYLFDTYCFPYFTPMTASLVWAAGMVLLWLLIPWIFYHKKIFIKL